MNRLFVGLGGLSAALAVGLGAFAAHVLKEKISPAALDIWQTAAHYHLIHAIALAVIGFACAVSDAKLLRTAGRLLLAGLLIFGGSLYVLALTDIKWLGAITTLID